jgi:putative Mg2+ transporter-C (MgtC) family protein
VPDLTAAILDDLLRLGVAAFVGMLVGLNRDVRGKAMGMRTLGLVSFGSALIAVAAFEFVDLGTSDETTARLVQGVIVGVMTGIGFLGAGAILRGNGEVHGLTTAATTWVAAGLGVACGFAAWHLVLASVVVTLVILVVMPPVERMLVRLFGGAPDDRPERGRRPVAPVPGAARAGEADDDRVVTRLTGYN